MKKKKSETPGRQKQPEAAKDELEELRRKSKAPCDKHENGECDCGKSEPKKDSASGEDS